MFTSTIVQGRVKSAGNSFDGMPEIFLKKLSQMTRSS